MHSSSPQRDPQAAHILGSAAKALYDNNRLDLVWPLIEMALAADPANGNCHSMMAGLLEDAADWPAALEHWKQAAALMPSAMGQRLNLALALLLRDDFRAGLPLFECRIDKPDWTGFCALGSLERVRARKLQPGQPVDGRQIVLFTEQGLGDSILYARYVPLLAARGARITLACPPTLRPLFERIGGYERPLSPPADQPHAKINLAAMRFDAFLPLMSLPWYFATDRDTLPAAVPYLRADAAEIAHWRARYAREGRPGHRRIGLVWEANPENRFGPERTMQLADLTPLTDLPGIDLVNLQHGPAGAAFAAAIPNAINIGNEVTALDRFAAAVAATDLMVSIDTMSAHCAGAMGHPVWIAVPRAPHWYWGIDRQTCPWYPTARLFRQERRRDWAPVVAAIARELLAAT
jgi:hypothetical protein